MQNPPVIPGEDRGEFGTPIQSEPQEVFGSPFTPILTRYDWMSRQPGTFPLNIPKNPDQFLV